MTSTIRSQAPDQRQSYAPAPDNFVSKKLCLIVGLVCVAGFAVDMLVLTAPPDPFALEWRTSFLQQVGDRGIILLFGAALLLYSQLKNRFFARSISLMLLGIGAALMLSSVLVVRDTLVLKTQTLSNIEAQSEQLQAEIETRRERPDLSADVTTAQFEQASQEVTTQTKQLKQNARNGISRAGIASISSLMVVGMGLMGLGRFGLTGNRQVPQ